MPARTGPHLTASALRRSALALVLPLALAGCGSIGPAPESQAPTQADSTAVAPGEAITCQNVAEKMQAASQRFSGAAERLASDPQAALGEIQSALDDLGAMRNAVTDAGLKERLDAAWAAGDDLLGQLRTSIEQGSLLGDLGALRDHAVAVGESVQAVEQYCRAQ